MAVYKQKSDRQGYGSGPWVDTETGAPCPESLRVAVSKLVVGDIVLVHDYRAGLRRSAVVTQIERHPQQSYGKKWKVTTVDGKGKVDVFEMGDGRSWEFERQCSQEAKENVEERSRNISLRRDIQRLERKVEDLVHSMDWFKQNGGKNPKMPDYRDQVVSFYQALGIMYDDVGKDLGLPPRAKRKKKK